MNILRHIFFFLCVSCRGHKSRTVRVAFSAVIVSALALSAMALLGEDDSYILLELPSTRVEQGELFTIKVFAVAQESVNAVDITLRYDESQLDVFGIDTGESVITLWTSEPTVSDGGVTFSGGTYRRGFRGKHLLATINARAQETGIARFSLSEVEFLSGDGSGQSISVNEDPAGTTKVYVVDTDERPDSSDDRSLSATMNLRIATDINDDGRVGMQDISAFMSAWGTDNKQFDFNNDGEVSFRDFAIILADSFFK